MNETCNQIVYLLLDKEYAIPYAIINHEIKDPNRRQFMDSAIIELVRLKIINKDFDNTGHENYRISQPIKIEIRNLPINFENNPYGYFLDKEIKEKERESQLKWWESENARTQYENFPVTERRARRSEIYAIIALLLSITAIALQLICTKTN